MRSVWSIRIMLSLALIIAILEEQRVIAAPIPRGWPTTAVIFVSGVAQLVLILRYRRRRT